jgi:hypothetical protein
VFPHAKNSHIAAIPRAATSSAGARLPDHPTHSPRATAPSWSGRSTSVARAPRSAPRIAIRSHCAPRAARGVLRLDDQMDVIPLDRVVNGRKSARSQPTRKLASIRCTIRLARSDPIPRATRAVTWNTDYDPRNMGHPTARALATRSGARPPRRLHPRRSSCTSDSETGMICY